MKLTQMKKQQINVDKEKWQIIQPAEQFCFIISFVETHPFYQIAVVIMSPFVGEPFFPSNLVWMSLFTLMSKLFCKYL
jgi:hypothetical protein